MSKAIDVVVMVLIGVITTVIIVVMVAAATYDGPTMHSKCVGNEFRAYWLSGDSKSLKVVYDNSCVDAPYVKE